MLSALRYGHAATILCGLVFIASCGGGGGDDGGSQPPPPATYSAQANVSGLLGNGLSLSFNGGTAVDVTASGTINFSQRVTGGQSYTLTISSQPSNPVQECSATSGTGVVGNSNLIIAVSCEIKAPTSIRATVSLDTALPANVVGKVETISSALAMSAGGGELDIPWGPHGKIGHVLALDSDGEIVLAGLGDNKALQLSAETTAVTLTRLLMANVNENASSRDMAAAIHATAGFPALVTTIRDALAADVRLSESHDVARAINVVIGQLPASVGTSQKLKVNDMTMRDLAPTRVNGTPHPLHTYSLLSVSVSGASRGGGVEISNSMPISWDAATADLSNNLICGLADECGNIPRYSVFQSKKEIAGNGAAFNLAVGQSRDSREDNFRTLIGGAINLALEGLLPSQGCTQIVITELLAPSGIRDALNNRTPEGMINALLELKETYILDALKAAGPQCLQEMDFVSLSKNINAKIKLLAKRLSLVIQGIAVIDLGLTASFIAGTWHVEPEYVGVCVGLDDSTTYRIAPCAVAARFTYPDIYFAPEANAIPQEPRMVDANGRTTIAGAQLRYISDASEIASVDFITGRVTAGTTTGSAKISVLDEILGGTGTYTVHVQPPTLVPAKSQRYPGELVPFKFASPVTVPFFMPTGVQWDLRVPAAGGSSSDITLQLQSDAGAAVKIADKAQLGTEVELEATCPSCQTKSYGIAKFTVVADVPNVRLEYGMPPDGTVQGSYGLWGSAFFGSEGPQCIGGPIKYRVVIYNQQGNVQSDRTVEGNGNVCPGDELGWWPLRSDGRHWGLIMSGGVGSGGRRETTGTITLQLPDSKNPLVVPSSHAFTCHSTVATDWRCGDTPIDDAP